MAAMKSRSSAIVGNLLKLKNLNLNICDIDGKQTNNVH